MPTVGFGCWKLGPNAATIVKDAITNGWRHIDSASDYGNEIQVGEGIAAGLKEMTSPGLKREDLFVTSKLWNTFHHPENVEAACRKTLSDLKLDYLDLYLIHFPIALKHVPIDVRYPPEWIYDPTSADPKLNTMIPDDRGTTIAQTWEAMESLVAKGLVKNIGVANFPAILILELLKTTKVPISCNQIELHPHHNQQDYVAFLKRKGIAVTGFSPLGSAGYQEIGMDQKQGVGLLKDPKILKIAESHGKSSAQIMLRWGTQRGTAIIPKCSSVERLRENLAVSDFNLTEEDMEAINSLNLNRRYNDPGVFAKGMGGDYPIYL
jgi:D-xylose reductase